nr:hypothetical protein IUWQDXFC_IUWQDXFC_CDS_0008 [Microvirus sp.]
MKVTKILELVITILTALIPLLEKDHEPSV